MVRYETLFLTVPDFANDEFSSLETAVSKTIQDAKGVMISFERWGKYRLAYPIRDNDYGIYGLVRFEVEPQAKQAVLQPLHALFTLKYGDSVMRAMTVKLDPKKSLSYHRPESLEEAPMREDAFFKTRSGRDERPASVHDDEDEDEGMEEVRRSGSKFDHAVAAATPPAEGN